MSAPYPTVTEPARNPPSLDQQAGAGFSQVDLLTVIGVLVLLGLLRTPALAKTRVPDQAFQCRNNLRQLIHGWRMYAEDNNGKLPNCFDWAQGWLSYTPNDPDNTNTSYLLTGQLGPYVKNPAAYKCPADMSLAVEGGVRLPRVRSVSMSQSFCAENAGHLEDDKPGYYRHYLKLSDLASPPPANLWVLIDENPDSINDGAFAVKMGSLYTTWQDEPSILHDGGCGFAFADGHSEIKKWSDPRTFAMKVTYTTTFPYGFPQPNNVDIKWLQDRTTAPK